MPRPAFAKMLRAEKSVNQLRKSVRLGVTNERVNFVGQGRQAREVERHPADEPRTLCIGDRREPFAFERSKQEAVDFSTGPSRNA